MTRPADYWKRVRETIARTIGGNWHLADEFTTMARTALPLALDEIEEQAREIAKLREALGRLSSPSWDTNMEQDMSSGGSPHTTVCEMRAIASAALGKP